MCKVPNSGQQPRFEVHNLGRLIVFGNHIFPELEMADFLFEDSMLFVEVELPVRFFNRRCRQMKIQIQT